MAFSRTVAHATVADGTFSAAGAAAWDGVGAHTPAVTDATSGGIPYFSSTTVEASSALLAQYGVVIGGGAGAAPATQSGLTFGGAAAGTGLAIAAGTATTNVNALNISQTLNAAGVNFTVFKLNASNSASGGSTLLMDLQVDASSKFNVGKTGDINATGYARVRAVAAPATGNAEAIVGAVAYGGGVGGFVVNSTGVYLFSSNADAAAATNDSGISRISAGLIGVGTGAAGSFAGRIKLTSAIAAGVTVANLNAAPTTGEIQTVTDSLTPAVGVAVAAGGAAKAMVWYNGAQWTVFGI